MEPEEQEADEPKTNWAAMWQALAQITLILASLAYCTRTEIVEILR